MQTTIIPLSARVKTCFSTRVYDELRFNVRIRMNTWPGDTTSHFTKCPTNWFPLEIVHRSSNMTKGHVFEVTNTPWHYSMYAYFMCMH